MAEWSPSGPRTRSVKPVRATEFADERRVPAIRHLPALLDAAWANAGTGFSCPRPGQSRFWRHSAPDDRRSQGIDHLQDAAEKVLRHRHLGHLEDRVAGVGNDLRANLHELLPKRGQ